VGEKYARVRAHLYIDKGFWGSIPAIFFFLKSKAPQGKY